MSGKRRSIARKNNSYMSEDLQRLLLCQLVTDALRIKEWDRVLSWSDTSFNMKIYAIEQIQICDQRIDYNVNYLATSMH